MDLPEERQESIRMIRDSAHAVAPRGGDLRRIRVLRFQDPGFDHSTWREMCELGWLGLLAPEEAGGSGLGMAEFCALAEELGAALVPEPLIAASVAARVLPGEALAAAMTGEPIVLPAWQERTNSLDPAGEATFAAGLVNGSKRFVHMATGAEQFLVATRDGLALVAADAEGVTVAAAQTQDGGHFGTVTFLDAPGQPVRGDLAAALDEAALATAAYLLGMMERAFAMTLDHLRMREQFGRAVGSFQALQHRAADLKLQIALTRASVESAALTWDGDAPPAEKQAAVSRAKARASDAAMLVTRQAIQLHGGIGYTDEHDIGLYLRKAMVLAPLYGSAAAHRARYAAIAPEEEA